MKFTKQDLLTLLIGLFLFASCKDSNTIGLDLDADYAIKGFLVDTVTVNSQTMRDDITSGVGLIRHPLGELNDPDFGKTVASVAFSVGVPSDSYMFGTNATIDSAVLVMPYSTQFYGDTTLATYTVKVSQLTNDLSKEKSYLISKVWPIDATPHGTFTGKIKPNSKFKITDIVSGGPDTSISVIPQMRIKLDNNFIRDHIVNLDSASRSTKDKFFNSFKGLQVSATSTNNGGIMFFNFSGTDANIEIYYTKQNATTAANRDTVVTRFPITTTAGPVTASIQHEYTADILAQLGTNPPATDVTYLQALAGLKNEISFPYLKNFVTTVQNGKADRKIIVNKAELVIDLAEGTDVVPFAAAQRLALYRFDIAGQRTNLPDNDNTIQGQYLGDPRALGEALFGGYFDSVRKRYIFTITSYVQDLLDNKTPDYGTFLAPSSLTEFNVSPPLTSAARSVISKFKKGAAASDKVMKLNIYYTQIN